MLRVLCFVLCTATLVAGLRLDDEAGVHSEVEDENVEGKAPDAAASKKSGSGSDSGSGSLSDSGSGSVSDSGSGSGSGGGDGNGDDIVGAGSEGEGEGEGEDEGEGEGKGDAAEAKTKFAVMKEEQEERKKEQLDSFAAAVTPEPAACDVAEEKELTPEQSKEKANFERIQEQKSNVTVAMKAKEDIEAKATRDVKEIQDNAAKQAANNSEVVKEALADKNLSLKAAEKQHDVSAAPNKVGPEKLENPKLAKEAKEAADASRRNGLQDHRIRERRIKAEKGQVDSEKVAAAVLKNASKEKPPSVGQVALDDDQEDADLLQSAEVEDSASEERVQAEAKGGLSHS